MNFILFPTQLFELSYIPKEFHKCTFYLIEHSKFYGESNKMNFNKKKIILHKASCLAYINEMKNKININYIDKYPNIRVSSIPMFDIVDDEITKEICNFYKKIKTTVNILETPNFMTSKQYLEVFYKKNKTGKYIHNSFYKYQLELHNIQYITKSYDNENRNSIPINIKIPNINKTNTNKFVKEGIKFTEKKFQE